MKYNSFDNHGFCAIVDSMKKDTVVFNIECEMKKRWVPHFLSFLKYMQTLGNHGSSRKVTFFSDGDGDFRPTFKWDAKLPSNAKPIYDVNGDREYDAG